VKYSGGLGSNATPQRAQADAYFNGAIDDFRIYSRPLSEGEVLYLAGDR
jgi:hypothetical protein